MILLASLLSIPLFWLGHIMTPSPGQSSGNGNPAIIIMGILLIAFGFIIYQWIKILRKYTINLFIKIVGTILIIVHLIISFIYQRNTFIQYKENVLAKAFEEKFGYIDWQHIDEITSFLSIHVNIHYFNFNTYFMFMTSAILIALVVTLIPNFKKTIV